MLGVGSFAPGPVGWLATGVGYGLALGAPNGCSGDGPLMAAVPNPKGRPIVIIGGPVPRGPRPNPSCPTNPLAPKSGETASTARGRQAHKDYDPGPGYVKESPLRSGRRPDAVNQEAGIVRELKPNNPRAIKRGEKQVERYRQELEAETGKPFTGVVDTYDP